MEVTSQTVQLQLDMANNESKCTFWPVLPAKTQIYRRILVVWPGQEEVINPFFFLAQLSMKFSLLINIKMPIIVGIFIFISREFFMLSYV